MPLLHQTSQISPEIETRFDRWLLAIISVATALFQKIFAPLPSTWRERLITFSNEFLAFGIKQAWACLFGGLLLAGIIGTTIWYPENAALARYDFLFLYALSIQIIFLLTKMEHLSEAIVILLFHIVGTVMEVYKTDAGSWIYPEENFFRIGGVPLFSGFMYAAVGSYLARVMRIFDFTFTHYPRRLYTVLLAVAIYINFFTNRYGFDIRLILFGLSGLLYWRCFVHYHVFKWRHRMPMILGYFLVAMFIWFAENIGTITGTWLYPNQDKGWEMVSFSKMGSWYLLMLLSFVLVTLVHPPKSVRLEGQENRS